TQVNLPDGLTTIGDVAFSGCTRLTQVNLPVGLTTIGDGAFFDCTRLTQVNLPVGLTTIGDAAFFDCARLTQVNFPDGLTTIGDGAFASCTGLTQVTLPVGLTTIAKKAFYDCAGLTQVNFHRGLTTIGEFAFYGCISLTQLTLPQGLTTIGDAAFASCTGLTQITLPFGLTTIRNSAFVHCDNLEKIVVKTNDDSETTRIRKLLRPQDRHKVSKNPVYDDVIAFQNERLRPVLFHKLTLDNLHRCYESFYFLQKFPSDIMVLIAAFDVDSANNYVNHIICEWGFPVTPEAFEQYVRRMNDFSRGMKQQTILDTNLTCAMKLQQYVDYVRQLKTSKENRSTFFAENSDLSEQIDEKLGVTEEIIQWLKDEGNPPTEEEIRTCDPYVTDVLKNFGISLLQDDSQASNESKTDSPGLECVNKFGKRRINYMGCIIS
ncbi:MAG: leucine-rich repeat domain-containing protein, partial [Gammaproteobacteria bacterium]|nr:leucine-rich repeat domain-containing protein [Gammaproteobacteria bacterium]